ncbi:MAG: hypothetical protein ABSB09_14745 [Acidimicrobiales bacterium]
MSPTPDRTGAGTPPGYDATRRELQRVATHVLARARADHGGRFGLRATATGIATPPFGPDDTVLRLTGTWLVRERRTGSDTRVEVVDLAGRSLADAARFAGVDLSVPFSPGDDAPPVGDPDRELAPDPGSSGLVLSWFVLGARILDAVLPRLTAPTIPQVWPEHFDIAVGATTGSGGVTLGASPGDGGIPEPYLYVSPWEAGRPGDRGYWNAPFGAAVTRSDLDAAGDPETAGAAFVRSGLAALGPG